jgi:hypothetical protein
MSRVVTTAGRAPEQPRPSARREVISRIRQVLRDQAASDEDVDDALEAFVELSKSPE